MAAATKPGGIECYVGSIATPAARVYGNSQVAAAVVDRQEGPTHGVLYLPRKDVIIEAAKGLGCKINGEPVRLREGQVHEYLLSR